MAGDAANEARQYLDSTASVGEHLADQLLIPMALCGEGSFLTTVPTLHTTTNISIIERFLDLKINSTEAGSGIWKIDVAAESG